MSPPGAVAVAKPKRAARASETIGAARPLELVHYSQSDGKFVVGKEAIEVLKQASRPGRLPMLLPRTCWLQSDLSDSCSPSRGRKGGSCPDRGP